VPSGNALKLVYSASIALILAIYSDCYERVCVGEICAIETSNEKCLLVIDLVAPPLCGTIRKYSRD